jgi:hypothetical protein
MYLGMVVITSIVNVVPIATPKTVRLTFETSGIPASSIPNIEAVRHPNSEPNKKGRGAPKCSRRRLNPRQIKTVFTCSTALDFKAGLPCIHTYTMNYGSKVE